MRRRDLIAVAGASLLAAPAKAQEQVRLDPALPSGTRALARFTDPPEKRRMLRLLDRPPVYASPVDIYDSVITENDRFFVRYHQPGVPLNDDMFGWSLTIAGDAVTHPVTLNMDDLQDMEHSDVLAVVQAPGNRRGLLAEHVPGVQWNNGGVGCARWRGPVLRDLLKRAGVAAHALEVRFIGLDKPAQPGSPPYVRSLPIDKAMDVDTIIATSMNNAPLPLWNGYPARVVVPGWAGIYWMKNLARIEVTTRKLDNVWMQDMYRLPRGLFPVGAAFPSQETDATVPVTELVVNSVIADPLDGAEVDRGGFTVRGVAWDRGRGINRVEVSLDAGKTWWDAFLDPPVGRYAFRRFSLRTGLTKPGTYRVLSRATSNSGERQPPVPLMNPGGYFNNAPLPLTVVVS